jgi:predicted small lipoprotein YifL
MRAFVTGILVAGLALSACGRKGGLQPPPEIEVVDPDLAVESPVEAEKPDRPFILDGLL